MVFGNAYAVEEIAETDLFAFAADAGVTWDELVEEVRQLAPAAMRHARKQVVAPIYADKEREILLKVVDFIEVQAKHLLVTASACVRNKRLEK